LRDPLFHRAELNSFKRENKAQLQIDRAKGSFRLDCLGVNKSG
jgi:hypothetical protein